MTVLMLRQHLLFRPGQVVTTLSDSLCKVLIERGIAKEVDGDDVPNKMIESTDDEKAGDEPVHTKPGHRRGKYR